MFQLTNKPRKQDDQHFTPRKFTIAKKVRSLSDSSPDRFLRQFPPGKLLQQHSKDNSLGLSILNHVDSLNEYPKLYSQNSIVASSLSCSSESRSSSSDDNLANYSPIHHLDTDSPDHFEYFRMFEDASVTDVPGPSFSGANYRSDSCHANYGIFEDLNMNLLKIDLLDDTSPRRQSPVREERSPSAQGDVLNESLITLLTKELEKDESDMIVSSQEQRTRSPSSQRDPSDLPLISSISEELEIANQIKKENYSGKQSPSSEKWTHNLNMEEEASSAISMANKEEAVKDVEEDRSLDHLLRLAMPSYQCNDHPCSQLFYCQTCCKTICKECTTHCVYKHVTIDFIEFLETAQRQAEEVLIEAYLGIDVLADDMENMGVG